MDPQAAWQLMTDSFLEHDWPQVLDTAEGLLHWMQRGGRPPDTVPGRHMGSLWDEQVATTTCRFVASLARSVLTDPNGIPHDVPFSLSCCECDEDSPDTFEQAVGNGWTGIEFTPEGVAENFLGLCPEHSIEE